MMRYVEVLAPTNLFEWFLLFMLVAILMLAAYGLHCLWEEHEYKKYIELLTSGKEK